MRVPHQRKNQINVLAKLQGWLTYAGPLETL